MRCSRSRAEPAAAASGLRVERDAEGNEITAQNGRYGQYLKKGSQVYLEGKLKTRKWQDKDGQDRFTTEINADEMKMLGSKGDGQQQEGQRPQQDKPRDSLFRNTINTPKQPQGQAGGFSDFEDSIPF